MNKKIIICALFVVCGLGLKAQSRIDTLAVYILQHTSHTMQTVTACHFTATINYDVWNDELGLVKHSTQDKVYMQFPDKMKINSTGDKGRRAMWYNGDVLSYYSFSNNQYAETPAPTSIIETIDTINKTYGIEFPAGDFFYSTFVQDVVNTGGNLIYLGITEVNGIACFHIAGKDANSTFQFWINSEDDLFLPVKMSIVYLNEKESPQYEEIYSDWQLNTSFPDSMFEFVTPPSATKIKLQLVSSKK